jgi:hypothetical protein
MTMERHRRDRRASSESYRVAEAVRGSRATRPRDRPCVRSTRRPATHVRFVELTVGYDAFSRKREDLFAMNHRIAKVRVLRDGAALGERVLDPEQRGAPEDRDRRAGR